MIDGQQFNIVAEAVLVVIFSSLITLPRNQLGNS